MPKLGDLVVYFKADIKNLRQGISVAAKEIQKLNKSLARAGAGKLIGEFSQLNKEVDGIVARLRKVVPETMRVTKSFTYMGDNMVKANISIRESTRKATQSSIKNLASLQSFIGKVVHYITFSIGVQMVMGIRKGIEQLIETLQTFQRAITNAASVAGYLGASFDDAREKIAHLAVAIGTTTVYSAQDAARSLYSLASAGFDVVNMTARDLIPMVNYAAATQIDLDMAIQGVTKTMRQFGLSFEDATQIVDTFTGVITRTYATADKLYESLKYVGSIAGELNQDLATVSAALGVLYNRGLEGGQAGQRLNMIFTKLLKPTDKAAKRLEAMGLTLEDINPYTHDFVDILYKLKAAGFDAADAATMFRARTAAAAMILLDEVDTIARLRRELELSGGLTESIAKQQVKTLWGAFQRLRNETEAASLEFQKSLAPALIFLADILRTEIVGGIRATASAFKVITDSLSPIKPVIEILIKAFMSVVPVIVAAWIAMKTFSAVASEATVSAVAAAAGVNSIKAAMIGLATPLIGISLVFTTLNQMFPEASKYLSALFGVVVALTVAWKAHAAVLAVQNALLTANALITKGLIAIKTTLLTVLSGITGIVGALIPSFSGYTGVLVATAGATAGATAAQIAYNAALYACPILLIVAGLTLLVTHFEDVKNAVGSVVDKLKNLLGIAKKETVVTEEEVNELDDLRFQLKRIISLRDLQMQLESDIAEMEKNGISNTEEYNNKLRDLETTTNELADAESKALSVGKTLIDQMKNKSKALDKAITAYKSYIDSQSEIRSVGKDLETAEMDKEKALEEYINAINEYGYGSDEVKTAMDEYNKASQRVIELTRKKTDLTIKEESTLSTVNDVVDKLNSTDRERYNISKAILDVMNEITLQEEKLTVLQARRSVLENTLQYLDKILAEQAKDMWEKRLKLLEVETKLYKLRKAEPSALQEVFDALASQGMLTDEMIDAYKEMMGAQWDLIKTRIDYFKIMDKLSPEERRIVEEAIKKYEELRDEGVDAATAFEEAFGGLELQIPTLTVGDISAIGDFAEAEWEMMKATKRLRDVFGDILPDLEDMGVLTADQVEAWNDYLSIAPQIHALQNELQDDQEEYNTAVSDYITIMANLWNALQSNEQIAGNTALTWDLMKQRLDILRTTSEMFGGDVAMLNQLLGTHYQTLEEFTPAQLVAAAAILQAANDTQTAIDKTSTLNSLLQSMDVTTPWESFMGAAQDALDPLKNFPNTLSDIKEAINNLKDTIGDENTGLIGKLTIMISKLQEIADNLKPGAPWYQPVMDFFGGLWDKLNKIGQAISNYFRYENFFRFMARGAVVKAGRGLLALQRGFITRGPQLAVIGEAGSEAVVPLEGPNRRFGKQILEYILPRYYPELTTQAQAGGIFGTTYTRNVTYTTGPTSVEEYHIHGPINVTGVSNVNDFVEQLKYRARVSR